MSATTEKIRRDRLKLSGLCLQCRQPFQPGKSSVRCDKCNRERNEYLAKRKRKLRNGGVCECGRLTLKGLRKCQKCFDYNKQYYVAHRFVARRWATARYERDRAACFAHYGSECACCGEPEERFLQIDHINGGGREHRKLVTQIFSWLVSQGFPPGFQTLCANCNWAKRTSSCCPCKDTSCARKRAFFQANKGSQSCLRSKR